MNQTKEVQTQSKLYDPNALVERPMPKVGDRMEATITDIKSDKLGNLIPPEILVKWESGDANAPAIEIVAECSDGAIRRRTIQLPVDNQVHPNSNLAKWRNSYGSFPSVGQKVFLLADTKGFYQFLV